jgi:hypothetical protein
MEIIRQEGVHRIEYRYRHSDLRESIWRHCGDFGPGHSEVVLHGRQFPADLKPGERFAVQFRAYNGENYSMDLVSMDIIVNMRPVIAQATPDESPLTVEEGKTLTLPLSASDGDGDNVTFLYRIGDDVTWSVLPTSSGGIVFPADLASRVVSTLEGRRVEVIASDGLDARDGTLRFHVVPYGQGSGLAHMVFPTVFGQR